MVTARRWVAATQGVNQTVEVRLTLCCGPAGAAANTGPKGRHGGRDPQGRTGDAGEKRQPNPLPWPLEPEVDPGGKPAHAAAAPAARTGWGPVAGTGGEGTSGSPAVGSGCWVAESSSSVSTPKAGTRFGATSSDDAQRGVGGTRLELGRLPRGPAAPSRERARTDARLVTAAHGLWTAGQSRLLEGSDVSAHGHGGRRPSRSRHTARHRESLR